MTPPKHHRDKTGIVRSGNVTSCIIFQQGSCCYLVGGVMTPPYE